METLLSVTLGGDVDIPQSSQRVGDNLMLYHPDCGVSLLLFKFAAIFLRDRGWTVSPVVVELAQGSVDIVFLAGSQTGEGVVVENQLGPLSAVD